MGFGWWVPLTTGIEDGVNPCALINCAIFLFLYLWFENQGFNVRKFSVLYIASSFVVSFVLNLGFFANFLLTSVFRKSAVNGYKILAFLVLGLGLQLCFNLWRGRSFKSINGILSNKIALFAVLLLAAVMSVGGSIWPPNYMITILSNGLMMPGKVLASMFALVMYSFFALWLMVGFSAMFSWSRLTPRLRQIVCAAVFMSAAASVFIIF